MTLKTIKQRKMKCHFCGSVNISTDLNIGYDVDETGGENQHMDTCLECKATRMFAERIDYEKRRFCLARKMV